MYPIDLKTSADAASLEAEYRFLLWTLRAWVACCKARAAAAPVAAAFVEIGLDEGAAALEAALITVARATLRPLAIHCPGCPAVSDDETMLLGAFAAAQRQDESRARTLLGGVLLPPDAERAARSFARLGLIMALGGVMLPEPVGEHTISELSHPSATVH